jgi:hypothetical protein
MWMEDFLKNKLSTGLTDDEQFLILDALDKKPIQNPELLSLIQTNPSPNVAESSHLKTLIPPQEAQKVKKMEINPWVSRVALSLVIGLFIVQASGKKVIIDSNPFN